MAKLEPRPPVVDAHQHFWDPRSGSYPFLDAPEMAPIRRPYLPEDLRPALVENGVDGTVLVQTRSSLNETFAYLETAMAVDFVKGVVGWIDLANPLVADDFARLRARPESSFLVGLRHQVHDEPDPEWLLRPAVRKGLGLVRDAGFVYDLLVRTRELPAALRTVRDFPDMRFVLDHCAKPPIASGEIDAWAEALAPLAREPNVWCKLSGLVTEADRRAWTPDDLRPYVERVIDWFGEDRVMFGSDWPVCLLAASYGRVKGALEEVLGRLNLSDKGRAKVFGGNAIEAYRLVVADDPLAAAPGGGYRKPGAPS